MKIVRILGILSKEDSFAVVLQGTTTQKVPQRALMFMTLLIKFVAQRSSESHGNKVRDDALPTATVILSYQVPSAGVLKTILFVVLTLEVA